MSGVLAEFATEDALRHALRQLASVKVGEIETYTPKALDEQGTGSPLPLIMFLFGMLGFVGFFGLMAYADAWAYPLDIGGRPEFAWPSFMPIAFELGILSAMGAGFFGYFLVCRMPRFHDPMDACEGFGRASRDGWFLAVRSDDRQQLEHARTLLAELHAARIQGFGA